MHENNNHCHLNINRQVLIKHVILAGGILLVEVINFADFYRQIHRHICQAYTFDYMCKNKVFSRRKVVVTEKKTR